MLEPLDLGVLRDFATALLIGALVGVEREKRKAEEGDRGIAGLRTFILVALIGAVAGYLGASCGLSLAPVAAALLTVAALGPRRLLVVTWPRTPVGWASPPSPRRSRSACSARQPCWATGLAIVLGVVTAAVPGLQAAAARAGREARLGRCLCRGPAADRHLHHPAIAARPARPGGAQSLTSSGRW